MPNAVHWTEPSGVTPHLGPEEAEARQQSYVGPEHLLVGLLRQGDFLGEVGILGRGDDPAADLLRAHGLDLATVRAGIDRLVAQGVLPGPQLSDRELLATLGIDLDAVEERLKDEFGWETWYDAAGRRHAAHLPPGAPAGLRGGGRPGEGRRAAAPAARAAPRRRATGRRGAHP